MADTKQNTAKGKLLATGKGIAEMLRSCQKHHFTNDNTILEVDERGLTIAPGESTNSNK